MREVMPELIFDGRHDLAEGPVWHEDHLWWVNITAGELYRLNPVTGAHERRSIDGNMGCAVPTENGRWLVAQNCELRWLDWEFGATEKFCAVESEKSRNRFNDGQCDPRGRLWIGTMDRDAAGAAGSLYVIEADQAPRKMLSDLTISNGMAWSADGGRFYFTDTITRRVDVFDFDAANGIISNRLPFAVFGDHEFPDGMTLDADGNLWVSLWGAAAVVCLDGRTGCELRRILLPVSQPSSCVFGGAELDELFITTARSGLSASALAREPLAGGIFRVKPGVRGRVGRLFDVGRDGFGL